VVKAVAAAVIDARLGEGVGKVGLPVRAVTICLALAIFWATERLLRFSFILDILFLLMGWRYLRGSTWLARVGDRKLSY
jgi:hypothetical protein